MLNFLTLESHNKNLSTSAMWIMFIIGLLCVGIIFLVFFLFKRKLYKERSMINEQFLLKPKKVTYQVFSFWNKVLYIFLIFCATIGAIVLLSVSISSMF
ncbi:hypothetical protein [Spiroplasma endosymbiont of Polydrusus pterygomalis]|uniref:hypothetical protein n=1 Tax=Spiroplasma endosymbiont of Polydrusus pterygomalis TaxID=3139327 RepID=UPI003CCAA7F2